MVEIYEIKDKKGLRGFVDLAWKLYEDDTNWVPPLKGQLIKTLGGKSNPLFMCGPHTFFVAVKDGKPVSRVLTGINEMLNREKNKKEGYISLFETVNDEEAAFKLLKHVEGWLRERGVETVVGPVSPTNGDDSRGFLVKGFDGLPVLMNSYNPPYYPQLFEKFGFSKDMDLYAYYFDPDNLPLERYRKVVEYAMKKFQFHIDKFDVRNLDREIMDIKKILDVAMPESWQHLIPPSLEEIHAEFNALKNLMDPDLVNIARSNGEPIGFVVALPDYNQVLKKLNGRLFPLGVFKYLWYKRKIDGMRIFIQFVVPRFQNKAVNSAIFYQLMIKGRENGYMYGEGSTIAEMNRESIRSVEGAGGKLYRIYRIYRKSIR